MAMQSSILLTFEVSAHKTFKKGKISVRTAYSFSLVPLRESSATMPAIPTPTALVAARAIPSFRPLNISEDVLTAPPSDGFDPESGHDVVEIVLVIGILVSGT